VAAAAEEMLTMVPPLRPWPSTSGGSPRRRSRRSCRVGLEGLAQRLLGDRVDPMHAADDAGIVDQRGDRAELAVDGREQPLDVGAFDTSAPTAIALRCPRGSWLRAPPPALSTGHS